VVGEGDIEGLTASIGVVETYGNIRGLTVGGYKTEARSLEGVNISIIRTKLRDLYGVSVAGYNHIQRDQFGLTIGLYNRAPSLNGIQIGLLNYAGNNPPALRWLPLINAHFD
jgi:hypothetical protein